jgi:hypothetical protein
MWWLTCSGVLQKIPIKCARVGRKNRDGTVGKPWTEIYFFLALFTHTGTQGFSQDFETISHFCGTDFFFLIMNKQEYNELNLIISYVALLVGNGDWKPPRMGTYSTN